MRKILIFAMAAITSLLCGCSAIPDKPQATASETSEITSEAEDKADNTDSYDEISAVKFDIDKSDVLTKLNAEGGSYEGIVRSEGEYDGSGYVMLDEGAKLVHIASELTSQHYRIIIAAYSYSGATISLSTPNGLVGYYYLPPVETAEFAMYSIDNVYLPADFAMMTFRTVKGSAAIDYIVVEDSEPVADNCYRTAVSVVGKNTGISTISTMKFLTDNYGEKTFTAQNVTIGTNAEIDAVFAQTGRYPAIRCGDFMYSSAFADEDKKETAEKEIELALEYGKDGGMVSMGWHWISPTNGASGIYTEDTSFDLADAVTDYSVALSDIEAIEGLYDSAMISESCYRIIKDIDLIAEELKRFKKEYLTVIFQPIPDGDTDIYWWGGDPDSYKWLWEVMFKRLNEYHGLNNLIWVWNGTNHDYYPGDNLCDIIGQSSFLGTDAVFASRFATIAHLSPTDTKPVAITGCDKLSDPSALRRDNAMWLWSAMGMGQYTIREDGSYSEEYTNWQRLNDNYNSRLTITRDELPDMSTYGIEYMEHENKETTEAAQS